MNYGNQYKDRGMMKWAGFYLSEHTEMMDQESTRRTYTIQPKVQMDSTEINTILNQAQLKNRAVAIQLEECDLNGNYKEDIRGTIDGYDELGMFIGKQKVAYDEIRNVELINPLKWSDTNRFEV